MANATVVAKRPVGVTILAVLVVIQGILGIVGGVAIILLRNDHSVLRQVSNSAKTQVTSGELMAYGIIAIVLGVLYLLVAKGLFSGNGFSRALVAIVSILHLAGGIYLAIERRGALRTQGIVDAAIAAIVLLLIFSPSANRFFREN